MYTKPAYAPWKEKAECSSVWDLCEADFVRIHKILCWTQEVKCTPYYSSAPLTHHNTIGHEEHHPAEDMNHKEGYWQPAQVIILTAAKDIPMTCNRGRKWQIVAQKMAFIVILKKKSKPTEENMQYSS